MVVASSGQPVAPLSNRAPGIATASSDAVPMDRAVWLPAAPTEPAANIDPDGWYQRALKVDGPRRGVNALSLPVDSLSPSERAEVHLLSRHTLEPLDPNLRPFALPADRYTWTAHAWSVIVKADQHVASHVGILYRVVQVGNVRVPVGGLSSVMTRSDCRGRGYARATLARATAFVGVWLWAPFALSLCHHNDTGFYEMLGWRVADAPIWCEQPGGRVRLEEEVGVFLPTQGAAEWPSGPIDLCGVPW
jgi:GNAT superfamily N-acetyltransferase